MKTKVLHVVRHGKALQDAYDIQDNDRPLTVKGVLNNIAVAKKLFEQYPTPDLILSSYAARALHTAHIFAREMGYQHENVRVNEDFYFRGDNEILTILQNLNDNFNNVMIVGHNPDFTFVINRFGARISLSTSSVVTITFETDKWKEIFNSKSFYTYLTKE